ncbi:gamma-glutamyltransferase [Phytopseudomonas daroniae]|uniref:gamma-glutamyltransferase n=1 Tax=Phytopseudomonas daroniae TaxID=2487519 RepID=UPI001038331A|nr:gamma-glutamyltransferase [Pseudomonas daroniae]TBU75297.1 gamma-glutamyltransferase [Pseudomonas daroniae]
MRNLQLPGRSPVRATQGMAATSHPLATQTALAILKRGGNAMDAAIAAAAVLAVVEPQATGIGGDCFVLYTPAGSDRVLAFNGSGRAPQAVNLDWMREQGHESMPAHGPHAVTIPGAIDAWCRLLEDHGSLPLGEILQDAIGYAENGYVVADRVAADWAHNASWLAEFPEAAKVLLPHGRIPRAGDIHRNVELGRTLRRIARLGRAGFYEGPVAEDMVNHLRSLGGVHSLEDFSTCRGEYVEPIHTDYKGYQLYQVPPNNQGLTALLMLNTLAGFEQGPEANGARRLHLEIEAARLAYHERDQRFADPEFAKVPVERLLSAEHSARMQRQIDPQHACTDLPEPLFEHSDTVYLCVVDGQRNAVSLINSIYHEFGSGVMAPQSGVLLQNRGLSFRLDPEHPNCLAPGKRPMHTIMPGMLMRDGRVQAPLGVMGGDYQPTGQVHVLTGILDFGLDPQEALDAPRVIYQDGKVLVEDGVSPQVREALQGMGHRLERHETPLGGGQLIWIDWEKGTLTGASDPRKDGCALGF